MDRRYFQSFTLLSRKRCALECVCVGRERPPSRLKDLYSEVDSSSCEKGWCYCRPTLGDYLASLMRQERMLLKTQISLHYSFPKFYRRAFRRSFIFCELNE